MLKKKYFILNWLILLLIEFLYLIIAPAQDSIKEFFGAILIGFLFFYIGFCYIDDVIKKYKKGGKNNVKN